MFGKCCLGSNPSEVLTLDRIDRSTEMAFGAPFLLHLGISKANLAFVFIAGPLSGLLVQPIIGILTDNSTSKYGRRRPALAISCVLCAFSMLLLGFARPLAGLFSSTDSTQTSLTIGIVVFSVFAIDFSVNAVNALDRTLILDLVHSKQQSLANVWSARLSGMGSILGFFIGQVDLTKRAPFTWFPGMFVSSQLDSSEAQLRCVCVLVVILLLLTHAITMLVAKESPALPDPSLHLQARQTNWQLFISSLIEVWTGLITAAKGLSQPLLEVFRIQFFLSTAWYPVLFYGTSWVSDIAQSSAAIDPAAAMRLGSLSMLLHASFSFALTLVLPLFLQLYKRRFPVRSMDTLTGLWAAAILSFAFIMMSSKMAEMQNSTNLAMTTIGLTGFAWCLSTWAPYTLVGLSLCSQRSCPDLSHLQLGILLQKGVEGQVPVHISTNGRPVEEGAPLLQRSLSDGNEDCREGEDDEAALDGRFRSDQRKMDTPLQSGTVSGLHNVCLVLPQFLMTAFTSILFKFMQSEKDSKSKDAANFGFVLRIGGLAAFVSSYYAFRLARKYSSILEG